MYSFVTFCLNTPEGDFTWSTLCQLGENYLLFIYLFMAVLGFEFRPFNLLGRCSTTSVAPLAPNISTIVFVEAKMSASPPHHTPNTWKRECCFVFGTCAQTSPHSFVSLPHHHEPPSTKSISSLGIGLKWSDSCALPLMLHNILDLWERKELLCWVRSMLGRYYDNFAYAEWSHVVFYCLIISCFNYIKSNLHIN
jgi:hypothetical protein